MERGPGDDDLRLSAEQPRQQPQQDAQPSAFQAQYSSGGGGWEPPQQSEVIEYRGNTGYRIVAKIIDYFVVSILINILSITIFMAWFFASIDRLGFFLIFGAIALMSLAVPVLYYFVLEKKFQQTAGEKAFDLKVIDVRNGRASTGQLLARAILYTLSMTLYFWIVALVREDGRSVTDIICGTTVIRVKKVYYYDTAQAG